MSRRMTSARGKALYLLSLQRGEQTELKVMQAFRIHRWPVWLMSVRQATHEEDQSGVDLVLETMDRGTIYVQVKTRHASAQRWRAKHQLDQRTIAVVVIRPDCVDPAEVWGRCLGALVLAREPSLKARILPLVYRADGQLKSFEERRTLKTT